MALRKPLSWGAGTVIEITRIFLVGLPKQHVGCLEVAVLVVLPTDPALQSKGLKPLITEPFTT